MQNISELLSRLRKLEIRLQVDKDRLRVDAPVGVLSPSLREELSRHKSEIIQYFENGEFRRPNDLNQIPLLSRDGQLEVSFSQERLWFLSRLEPDNEAYHISGGIRLEGKLRVDSLEQSLTEIVNRHEVLRTTFEQIDDKPVQVISPAAAFKLQVLGLDALPKADRKVRLQQIIADEARRSFDLSAGPLFRAVLVRLGQQEHVLVLVMHHIITDGWSLGVFRRELESLYGAFCEGRPSPLADLEVQYADYAAWQRKRLQGKFLDTQVKYWKQKLGEELPILQLPTDRPRPAAQTHLGARHGFDLPQGLSERIEDLSRQQGVTLYMMLLAAFKVLLYRYTGQVDFGVGSPIANRRQPELEDLIGFFVNTLVLRTNMSGDPGFFELLSRVRETTLGAFDHQELPFEKLVEVVNPAREMSYSPLFQVMFVLQNMPRAGVQLPGLRLSSVGVDGGASMFDLTLYMWEWDQRLHGSVEFNTDLFDAERIERMVGHFQRLLEGIVADPGQCIGDLPILDEAERRQLLVEWNDTVVEYSRDKCIHELFENQVERTPDAIALADKNKQISYQQLNARSNQLAYYLKELGVGPQVVVGLCTKRSVEMVIGIMSILKAGGIYLPLDPSYPEQRLLFMLEDSQALILLSDENSRSVLPKSKIPTIYINSNDGIFSRHSSENPVSSVEAETPTYIIYTSGSTGRPKGVIGLQRGLLNRFNWMWKTYPFEAGEVCCQKTSISFVDSIWEILGPLIQGIKTVIISDEEVKEPGLFIKKLADEQVTRIIAVPSYLRVMLDAYPDLQNRLPQLKFWISSGEILTKELYQRFCEKMPHSLLLNLYGSSEVSADVTCYDTNSMSAILRSVPIGRPIANTQVYILAPNFQPVPVGVPGEMYIGGDNLAAGYLNLSQITENAFIPNPFSDRPDSRLFKSGDIGRWLSDGNIEVIGRVDHQVKIRGYRIEMGEIEAVLNTHPQVDDCAVVAREDRPDDRRLVAYVVFRQVSTVVSQELYRFVKQRLPEYMLPSAFVILDTLPLTPSGKIDRHLLPAPDRMRSETTEDLVAPRDELEMQLAKTWEKVLGVQPIGVNDNFFELGGHSLLAVQLFTQIEKILGKNLPLTVLFQSPTVQQMADVLRELGWSAPLSSLEAIESETSDMGGIKQGIKKYIPVKSVSFVRKQYLKHKEQPGYNFVKDKYLKLKRQPANLYLKREYLKAKRSLIKRFFSYQPFQLEKKLREMGLSDADSVYMHSAYKPFNGFSGGPYQIIDCILNVIGDSGNLMMVSMPYTGYTVDYLKEAKTFDVTKTESSMGIITEIFRRRNNVLRSLNPAHPILAFGPDAEWIISDHQKTMYSCGKGSPFEKILELNAKAILFDVPFWIMTFFHFLEDKFKDCSPVNVYEVEPIESTVIDSNGDRIGVKTYVSSKEARKTRSARVLKHELENRNQIKTAKIGNTKLKLVNLNDIVGCAQDLVNAGKHFYVV